jgi:hypothetical protein
MTDNQAQKFQWVLANGDSSNGSWHLQLRPVTHAADSPDHLDSVNTVLSDGLSRSARRVFGR